jgi:hypothetical protein
VNADTAKTLVFVSGGLMIALALLSGQGNTYKRVWAAGLWTTLLAVVADVAPELTGWFSVAIIVAAVAANQGVFGAFLTGDTKQPTSPGAAASASGSPTAQTARVQ